MCASALPLEAKFAALHTRVWSAAWQRIFVAVTQTGTPNQNTNGVNHNTFLGGLLIARRQARSCLRSLGDGRSCSHLSDQCTAAALSFFGSASQAA